MQVGSDLKYQVRSVQMVFKESSARGDSSIYIYIYIYTQGAHASPPTPEGGYAVVRGWFGYLCTRMRSVRLQRSVRVTRLGGKQQQ